MVMITSHTTETLLNPIMEMNTDLNLLGVGYIQKGFNDEDFVKHLGDLGLKEGWTVYFCEDDGINRWYMGVNLAKYFPSVKYMAFASPDAFLKALLVVDKKREDSAEINSKTLIITDYNMDPYMNGGDFAKAVRAGIVTEAYVKKILGID